MAAVTVGSARVLIVDDKADIRSIVATRLRIESTFEVVGEAANGAEAIARIAELKPQIMILDLQMPVMSGEEVIPILRSLAPTLRILVFSAYAGAQQRLRPSERPDAEVRKGTGLTPLVKELHRLIERTASDVVQVDLGILDVQCSQRAVHAWTRLSPGLREAADDATSDVLSLVGVFLALAEPLKEAADSGLSTSSVCFHTRLEAGRAARRALAAIDSAEADLLEPLYGRLLSALPAF